VKRILALATVLVPLAALAELVDRVAAIVDADIVTQSEVEAKAAPELSRMRLDRDPAKRGEQRQEMLNRALEAIIGEKLMDAQVRELSIEVTDAEVDLGIEDVKKQNNMSGEQFETLLGREGYSLASYRSYMKKHMARMKLVNLKVRSKVKIADEDLKAEYARFVHDEAADFEVRVRQILVQVPARATPEQNEAARLKAVALAAEASGPGVDFAELARKKSEGPSAADGGDLGFFRRGVMVPAFERPAFTLPVGGVSEPVRTDFGWHVIKVVERRTPAVPALDEVKEQLREKLLRSQLDRYTAQYVQELKAASVVEVKM